MIRKTVLALAAVATSAGTIAGSVVSGVNAPLAAAAAKSVVVPLSVTGAPGSEGGVSPMVEVRVGAAKPVPVVLDTGSSGLHLFDNAVKTAPGAGVSVTTRLSNITYAGGYRFAGVVASAVVTVGSQATAGRVPFSLVNTASCTVSKPTCRAAGGMAGFEAKTGADGILGIGTQSSRGSVTSPILAMPGILGQSWSVHLSGTTGTLVLGARAPRSATTAVTFQMKPLRAIGSRALWNDSALAFCTTIGTARACTPGLFDTGTPSFQVSGPMFGPLPTTTTSGQVRTGLPVTVAQTGARTPFWTFTTGAAKSQDLVRIRSRRGPYTIAGVQAFYTFTIHYDDQKGTITLSK